MSTQPQDPPSASPLAPSEEAARGDVPYQLEPDAARAATPGKEAGPRSPELNAPGLIDDFDEDAVLDLPPGPAKPMSGADEVVAAVLPPFVKPGKLPIKIMLSATGLVTLLSVIVAVRSGSAPWYAEVLLAVYHTLLHSIAGLLAVVFAARMASREVGEAEVAFVRMVFAVALSRTLFMLDIPIPFTDRVDELLLSVGAYGASVAVLFRLAKRDLQIVVGTQFVLSMVLIVGASIETWHAGLTPPPPAATPGATPAASR